MAQGPDLADRARGLFDQRHLSGAVLIQDVRTGSTIASVSVGDGANGLPLSVVKLLLMTLYWEHRDDAPASLAPDVGRIIARGADDPGRRLALDLRRALGSRRLLGTLARLGFPGCTRTRIQDCTTLSAATPGPAWANSLSLGENGFRVTPHGLSRFLRIIGNGGIGPRGERVVRPSTARLLQQAMLETVRSGTASGVRERLGTRGRMGGKTGTGPGGPRPYDGVFAGLIFDAAGTPRYTVVTYVRRGGPGGGVAAEISAELGARLLAAR